MDQDNKVVVNARDQQQHREKWMKAEKLNWGKWMKPKK